MLFVWLNGDVDGSALICRGGDLMLEDDKKTLNDVFTNLEASLNSGMNIRIEHDLEDGKYREHLLRNILNKIVPKKYSITNGFIIDSNNNRTEEMDIIIYDSNYVPPFFEESYTIVPIEAVVAVIQVKTTLTRKQLSDAIRNVNSIDKLHAKTGGKIISANGYEVTEKRNIQPYKIIVSKTSNIRKDYTFDDELKSVDIIYIVDNNYKLFVKDKDSRGVVNNDLKELLKHQNENISIKSYDKEKFLIFSLTLLDKLKIINNSIIINYQEYLKGAIDCDSE